VPGIKHLIECHCVLAIYRNSEKIINHKFPVYSKIDEKGNIIKKLVKCNNCEAVHLINEFCRSEIKPGKDQTQITINKDDLKYMLPEKIGNFLEKVDADIATYEQVIDIIDEERWGESVIIKRDVVGEDQHVKFLKLKSSTVFKIESSTISDIVR
jgi:hypothetical protein